MKISTERLKQIIQEELANDVDENTLILLEQGPQIIEAFQPIIDLYNTADDADKEQVENDMVKVFKNIIRDWRRGRENPDAWKSGY